MSAIPGVPSQIARASAARRWRIGGRVQGVGYRPFVYRLAHRHHLAGWVRNEGGEVQVHAEGPPEQLERFGEALIARAPPAAAPLLIEVRGSSSEPSTVFRILTSCAGNTARLHVPVDLFTCDECLTELCDPKARRYRYPFINCTQCGPRYTLIRALPYDRANTTLADFPLCRACAAEYADPLDRRFHAEPLACAECGPSLSWQGGTQADGNEAALAAAAAALRAGEIIAVRGVGGYHLLCDARREDVVVRLRLRKHRPGKPLAVMLPWRGSDGLEGARAIAWLSSFEAAALRDPVRPIVIVRCRTESHLAPAVAPGLKHVALMLPYSPLHHLLLQDFDGPVVATSGNISGAPVLTEPEEANTRLAAVADGFLHHDRPIARPADDPVVRVIGRVVRPVRQGRGAAPVELSLQARAERPVLAVGAYQKTTVALAWEDRAVVSPHIGELASPRGRAMLVQVARDLQELYGVRATCIAHDTHAGFPNTRWAREVGLPTQAVPHHHAHASAVAGEYPDELPLLCFTWDGLGLGPDRTLWGGEALLGRPGAWQRVASFRSFRLTGAERVAREPWRSALALCWESDHAWPEGRHLAAPLLREAWQAGLNTATTSSAGRLFDAAAALLGICTLASYEGEAAMRLEALCDRPGEPVPLPLALDAAGLWRCDWAPLLRPLLDARRSLTERAAQFHASLAHSLLAQALVVRERTHVSRVGLCGGVFQNQVLTEAVEQLLSGAGFEVLIPKRLPVNDAAISFGQLIETIALQAMHRV